MAADRRPVKESVSTVKAVTSCVLLADRHHGLTEGVRGLLATSFESVVMVADEASLYDSAARLHPNLVVVDLSLPRGQSLEWLTRLRECCSTMKLILISVHDQPSVCRSAMEAGADGFVLKRAIATELLPAVDAVLNGKRYVSLELSQHLPYSTGENSHKN